MLKLLTSYLNLGRIDLLYSSSHKKFVVTCTDPHHSPDLIKMSVLFNRTSRLL